MGEFDLIEWNSALVKAVFFDRADSSPLVTRIDATDNFLAQASGIDNPAQARESFLGVMPHAEHRVRQLFDPSVMYRWNTNSDDLPFYAQLHLTILAASAEESLQDEGNFRVRLAQMLGLQEKDYVSGGCLPALWENARQWSINRSERRGDIRRLVLPDPGNETIIGYSKRLAFPGFRDQNRLAEVFTRTGTDSSSALPRLLQVIRSNLFEFSDRFRAEFRSFARLIESNDLQKASGTPFWDAIEETSWSRTKRSGSASRAGCRLEIDPTDPYAPGLWLFCQNAPKGDYDIEQDVEESPYENLIPLRQKDGRSAGCMLEMLRGRADSNQYHGWLGVGLECSLKEGCVGFVEDDDGRWLDSPFAPVDAPFWILVRKENDWLLHAPVDSLDRNPVYRAPLVGSSLWSLFGPIQINDRVRAWLDQRIFVPDLLATRLARNLITVVGSVRREDGAYFWLPPVVPAFRCQGAKTGNVLIEIGELQSSFELQESGGTLTLPVSASQGIDSDMLVRVSVFDSADKEISRARFRFSDNSSALQFKAVRSPTSWLESGINGRLEEFSLDPMTECPQVNFHSIDSGEDARPFARSKAQAIAPLRLDPKAVDERWVRTLEILSAIYARRYALPIGECSDLMARIWGAYETAWQKIDELLQNGVIRQIHARHWSNQVLIANPLSMVAHKDADRIVLRAIGLTSQAMRAIIEGKLGQPGRWISSPDGSTAGALEYELDDEAALASLESGTGWAIHWVDDLVAIHLPTLCELCLKPVVEDLKGFPDEEKRVWSHQRHRFEDIQNGITTVPRLEKWRAPRHQSLFVMYRTDGIQWNTDSRTWALLAYTFEHKGLLGEVLNDGSLVLAQPRLTLPVQVGRRTVACGGGVCFRSPNGAFVYPSDSRWSPVEACIGWVSRKHSRPKRRSQSPQDAISRYAYVVNREKRNRRV